jgi:hypothetical protein
LQGGGGQPQVPGDDSPDPVGGDLYHPNGDPQEAPQLVATGMVLSSVQSAVGILPQESVSVVTESHTPVWAVQSPVALNYEAARPAAHTNTRTDAAPAAGLDDLDSPMETANTLTDATVYDTCYADDGWMD